MWPCLYMQSNFWTISDVCTSESERTIGLSIPVDQKSVGKWRKFSDSESCNHNKIILLYYITYIICKNVTDLWDHKNRRLTNSKYPFPDPDLSSCHRQLKFLYFRKLLEIEIRSPWKLFELVCWSTDGILIKPWRGINWVPQVITIKFTIKL